MEFQEKLNELYKKMGESFVGSLATIDNDSNPAVRVVSMLIIDGCIYFQTDLMMDKAKEIQKNNAVAVCVDGVGIKGVCEECGLVDDNPEFKEKYRTYFLNAYNKYSHLVDERVYRITPVKIKCWSYIDNQACYEIYDLKNGIYRVENYQKGK